MSKRIGREFWTRVVEEYESQASEQMHWEFCEEWGLKLTTFRSWLYRLRRERLAFEGEVGLVPIEVTGVELPDVRAAGSAGEFSAVDAAFPGGMVLRFQAGTDPGYMAELLSSVSRRLG